MLDTSISSDEQPQNGIAGGEEHPRRPIWNVISILAPLIVGLPTNYLVKMLLRKQGGDMLTIIFIPVVATISAIGASWLVGVIAGIISICRRERFRRVTFAMLGVYGVILIWVLAHWQR